MDILDIPSAAATPGSVLAQLAELRRAFDQSFAEPARGAEQSEDLVLAVRAGADPYAIRLSEIAGIHECPKIVPLPGVSPACLGLVGLRGRLHGVFRLSTLLGAPPARTPVRWLLVAPGRESPPTFAVDSIETCLAVAPEELRAAGSGENAGAHVRALFVRDGIARGLLHVPSLVALATGGARGARGEKVEP